MRTLPRMWDASATEPRKKFLSALLFFLVGFIYCVIILELVRCLTKSA